MATPNPGIYALMLTLHNLATAIWVGGMFALMLAIMPSARSVLGKGKELKQLLDTIKKKLSVAVYVSFVILFLTGILLAKQSGQTSGSFFDFSSTYTTLLSIKHILYFVVVIVGILRSRVIDNMQGLQPPQKEKWNKILLLVNLTLGIVIVFLSAQLTATVKFAALTAA